MLYFTGTPTISDVKQTIRKPASSASIRLLFVRFLACLYIHFSAVSFWNFFKAVHFMLVGLLSSDSYQSIFLLCAFLIYNIQCKTHLITAKRLNCQVSVHKCTDKGKFAKICNICHHFEYQTDLLQWERSVTFTLFFSKLLKLLKMMCSLCSFKSGNSIRLCRTFNPYCYFL